MSYQTLMLSNFLNRTYVVSSGATYTSDPTTGVIANVTAFQDVQDLIAAGCAVLNPVSTGLLFYLKGANLNSTADQIFTPNFMGKFRIDLLTALNTSLNAPSTVVGGIFTAPSAGGTAIVAAGQTYSGMTNASTALDLTLNAPNAILASGTPLYLHLATPQGAAATCDIYGFGKIYP